MSIVGFADLPVAALLTPRLTTVCRPARDMGYQAATLPIGLLGEEPAGEPHAPLKTSLQVRDSVASPPDLG